MYLQDISQQLTIYVGICLFIAGIIGNGINIWIFIGKRSYRTTPCTFYFLIESIYNILIVCISLSDRILNIGFDVDIKHESNLWCKIRQFSLAVLSPLSITCSCLAMIDQFLVTSRSQSLRNCSQMKWTYRMLIIANIIWFSNGIPYVFYYNVGSVTNSCVNTNPNFDIYIPIFLLGMLFLIPISVMSLFGWLTYRNIHQTIALVKQNIDYQLVKMTLFQVGLAIVSFFPYGIYNTYALLTTNLTKNNNRTNMLISVLSIITLVFYLFNTVNLSFYYF